MADSTETRKERRASAREERGRAAAAQARRRQRLWILGGALALAAAIVVVIAIAAGGNNSTKLKQGEVIPGQAEATALFAGIPQNGITLGDPRSPVTFVEFADLQCPFCREYTAQVMTTLVNQYVRTGKMKMQFRNVAFIGTDSARAAQMAAAAGRQNRLWPYVDIFYTNQQQENSGYVTDDFLRRIGAGVKGLDVEKAMSDRGLPEVQRQLNDAQTEWQTNGFTGTPSFLVGPTGGRLAALDVRSFDPGTFTSAIDKVLAQQGR
ncbi:MAG TPA: thioredoxin domain-containing protein [Conexibacter sp.]|jgi:protein-disulfide isomerase|nr:thioredoxin domain-containing protein [Conexibacter sp.]